MCLRPYAASRGLVFPLVARLSYLRPPPLAAADPQHDCEPNDGMASFSRPVYYVAAGGWLGGKDWRRLSCSHVLPAVKKGPVVTALFWCTSCCATSGG